MKRPTIWLTVAVIILLGFVLLKPAPRVTAQQISSGNDSLGLFQTFTLAGREPFGGPLRLQIAMSDPTDHVLVSEIEFKSGGVYQYQGVPEPRYKKLMAASAIGSYFHREIKDWYVCRKIA